MRYRFFISQKGNLLRFEESFPEGDIYLMNLDSVIFDVDYLKVIDAKNKIFRLGFVDFLPDTFAREINKNEYITKIILFL